MKFSAPPWLKMAIISIVVGAVLGVVNELTEGPIAQQAVAAANAARQACFAEADSFEAIELSADSGVDSCYAAMKDGELAGYVAQVTVTGFGGPIEIHVGMNLEQTITGISVGGSDFSETPGLGAKAKDPDFTVQFAGLTIPTQLGSGVEAITGATITSGAVSSGVNKAGYFIRDLIDPPAEDNRPEDLQFGGVLPGATITSETAVDCVNRALEAAQPYLDPSKATDIALMGESTAPAISESSGVTVLSAEDWAEAYPEIYASYLANSENDEVLDHVEEYPMIGVVYEGMAFNKYYGTARGHTYTVQDVTSTGRPHALANYRKHICIIGGPCIGMHEAGFRLGSR